jgi:hypothetical protein
MVYPLHHLFDTLLYHLRVHQGREAPQTAAMVHPEENDRRLMLSLSAMKMGEDGNRITLNNGGEGQDSHR